MRLDNRGVTLVELMIVLVVVSIGILALTGVQTSSTTDVFDTGQHTRALGVAQTRMEVARTAGYLAAVSDSGATGPFNWVTVVDSAGPNLRGVRVTVSWTERGTAQSVELRNLLARR